MSIQLQVNRKQHIRLCESQNKQVFGPFFKTDFSQIIPFFLMHNLAQRSPWRSYYRQPRYGLLGYRGSGGSDGFRQTEFNWQTLSRGDSKYSDSSTGQKDPVLVPVKLASERDDMDSHTMDAGIKRGQRSSWLLSGANRVTGYLNNNRSCWEVLWGSSDFIKPVWPLYSGKNGHA